MIVLGKLGAFQPALAFAPDTAGLVVAACAAKDLGKALADLRACLEIAWKLKKWYDSAFTGCSVKEDGAVTNVEDE